MTAVAPPRPATLALADGTVFRGRAFGAETVGSGEICFNTSMTGYQEILTDPSYAGQLVVMTCPEIGNVGTNPDDDESARPFLRGFVVREVFEEPSNWRARGSLDAFLRRHGVPGIAEVDTRALVRRIRDQGFQNAVLSTDPALQEPAALVERARSAPGLDGRDLVAEVTCAQPYTWSEGVWSPVRGALPLQPRPEPRFRLVAYDYGVKRNILRLLVEHGFDVTVVPATHPAEATAALEPDGVFLSNGPGDPSAVRDVQPVVRELAEREVPIFGICLGHQILGLALGGRTHKLRFGHHGGNQPGQDLASGKVAICAENHGYAVDADSLREAGEEVDITHRNLNDGTVEGLAHARKPVFSVQYHPEASPGPHDAGYFFGRFRELVSRRAAGEPVSGAAVARGRGPRAGTGS